MKRGVFGFLVLLSLLISFGKQLEGQNAFYVEFLGRGLLPTLIGDFQFDKEPGGPGFAVGITGYRVAGEHYFAMPFSLYHLFGSGTKFFEIGAGFTYLNNSWGFFDRTKTVGHINIGIRRQLPGPGVVFRAALTPLIGHITDDQGNIEDEKGVIEIWPLWGSISFGYSF